MAALTHKLAVEYVPLSQLKPFAGNPRKISEKGLAKIEKSIGAYGFVNPVLVQRGTNMIIAGHQRVRAAQAAGEREVPVIYLDFDNATAKAYNIADNRTAQEAEWDFAPLADLLQELDSGAFDITLTGFDEDELERMMNWTPSVDAIRDVDAEEPGEVTMECPKCGFRWVK